MFWRTPHTSTGATRRAFDLVRASLLLEPLPFDWASELDWPHDPAESRTLEPQSLTPASHRPPLRLVHSRTRAGAVAERQQHCLSPVGQGTPQIRSRSNGRELNKHAAGR
jgi:hypothetical protein